MDVWCLWRCAAVRTALAGVVFGGWVPCAAAQQTDLTPPRFEILGGVGAVPNAVDDWTAAVNLGGEFWATEHWGVGAWYTHGRTTPMEYLPKSWITDRVTVFHLGIRYRHRLLTNRTYGYIGVSPLQYRTLDRWAGRDARHDPVFAERSWRFSPVVELFVGLALTNRFSVRVGGHLHDEFLSVDLAVVGGYSFSQ